MKEASNLYPRKEELQKEEEMQDGQLLHHHSEDSQNQCDCTQKRLRKQSSPYQMTMMSFCSQNKNRQKTKSLFCLILLCMIFMTLILSCSIFYKDWIRSIIAQLNITELQKHPDQSNQAKDADFFQILGYKTLSVNGLNNSIYNLCPNSTSVFHTYYNETDRKMRYVNEGFLKKSKKCNITIYGFEHLKILRRRWDSKFPEHKITLSKFQNMQDKELLLILLQLYFHAGTYMNIAIPYSKISDRCWKYALTGYDILFADFLQENEKGIVVPDMNKFMKVRFPFSVQIKQMIERLIHENDLLEQCKKEQCLIIKCFYE